MERGNFGIYAFLDNIMGDRALQSQSSENVDVTMKVCFPRSCTADLKRKSLQVDVEVGPVLAYALAIREYQVRMFIY